jgi:hypothetical protein
MDMTPEAGIVTAGDLIVAMTVAVVVEATVIGIIKEEEEGAMVVVAIAVADMKDAISECCDVFSPVCSSFYRC